jgi:hypothetical protein
MNMMEAKSLQIASRVYWQGDAGDGGNITEMSWDAATIVWDSGEVSECTLVTCAKYNVCLEGRIAFRVSSHYA